MKFLLYFLASTFLNAMQDQTPHEKWKQLEQLCLRSDVAQVKNFIEGTKEEELLNLYKTDEERRNAFDIAVTQDPAIAKILISSAIGREFISTKEHGHHLLRCCFSKKRVSAAECILSYYPEVFLGQEKYKKFTNANNQTFCLADHLQPYKLILAIANADMNLLPFLSEPELISTNNHKVLLLTEMLKNKLMATRTADSAKRWSSNFFNVLAEIRHGYFCPGEGSDIIAVVKYFSEVFAEVHQEYLQKEWEFWHQGDFDTVYIRSGDAKDMLPAIIQLLSQRDLQALACTEKIFAGSHFMFNFKTARATDAWNAREEFHFGSHIWISIDVFIEHCKYYVGLLF